MELFIYSEVFFKFKRHGDVKSQRGKTHARIHTRAHTQVSVILIAFPLQPHFRVGASLLYVHRLSFLSMAPTE